MLYFGSFNPVHKGHIALAEYVLRKGLCDSVALIVSPQNPLKNSDDLLPEMSRFEMAETACRESAFPSLIQPSAVEFLLPKPSYTIDTLRFLQQNSGHAMQFSILMGADNLERFDQWKESGTILSDYTIYVYPRSGYDIGEYAGRVVWLADAPVFDCSATEIRNRLHAGEDASEMLPAGVAKYIAGHGLLKPRTEEMKSAGREYFRRNEWGKALNAFRRVLATEPDDTESREYVKMIEEILEFRYKDIYNP